MAYCRHCGMDSKDESKCEWCGKALALAQAAPGSGAPVVDNTPAARMARMDAEAEQGRNRFYITTVVLIVLASAAIFARYQIYPVVALAVMFVVGRILVRNQVIEPFSDDWFLVAFFFLMPMPLFFVLIAFIVYEYVNSDMNYTFIWLVGTCVVVSNVLSIPYVIAGSKVVSLAELAPLLGLERLCFIAAVLGWRSAGSTS